MQLRLSVPINLYSEDKKGKEKLIKRNACTYFYIDSDLILSYQEVLNTKGNVYKNRCKIYIRSLDPIIVQHSIKDLNLMINAKSIVGFGKNLIK